MDKTLKDFIDLVESKNLLFTIDKEEDFVYVSKRDTFLNIENFLNYYSANNKIVKYDLAAILDISLDNKEAIKILAEYFQNDKIEDQIISYTHKLVVSLAEELKSAYKETYLDELDNCLVIVLSQNLLYENKLGVFHETYSDKNFIYRGPTSKAFHRVLNRPDTVIIKGDEIFFNKKFLYAYFNYTYLGKADFKKLDFFNYKKFIGKYKVLPLWRLKVDLFLGSFRNIEDFDMHFFTQNNGYYFNIENIIKKVEEIKTNNLNHE
jgi:hypothetical protein